MMTWPPANATPWNRDRPKVLARPRTTSGVRVGDGVIIPSARSRSIASATCLPAFEWVFAVDAAEAVAVFVMASVPISSSARARTSKRREFPAGARPDATADRDVDDMIPSLWFQCLGRHPRGRSCRSVRRSGSAAKSSRFAAIRCHPTNELTLSDGRKLAYGTCGDPNGSPVNFNHVLCPSAHQKSRCAHCFARGVDDSRGSARCRWVQSAA